MTTTTNNESFNADELEAPKWLNDRFIEEVLSKNENAPELKVLDVQMSPASEKGDHYASVMFRGNATYTTEKGKFSKSLIIKTMPEAEGHKKEMLSESHLFETEIGLYTKVLPKFEQILRDAGDNTRLYVPCIYTSLKPRQVMVFEDLVPQGYEVIRDRESNIEEIKSAFSKLAKWHAVSVHVLHEQPDYLQEFKYGMFDMPTIREDPFVTTGMSKFIAILEDVPELRKYLPFFKNIENDYLDRCGIVLQEYRKNRQPNGYYVLCHGDFHLRNMMFKHNKVDGKLEDVMLIDFQISNICPITIDLIYAIYLFMGVEDRQNNYKELINYYFSEFIATLQKIGFKGELPNSEEFWKQMSQHKYYEIFLLTTFLPLISAFMDKSIDVGDVMQKDEVRMNLYRLDNYIQDAKGVLSRFEKLGYFD
ncbi:GH18230 [Drosophila grimshawi]|uniref:GH18230 n=1 Tax=Drosophila grimshawi TaxID=7222 RepID=B4JFQ3_DROGR|nr:GH18230 [Drosophila grimshawi]